MNKRQGMRDAFDRTDRELRVAQGRAARSGAGAKRNQVGQGPLRWYNDPTQVPVAKATLLDLLETAFPEVMFSLLVHKPNSSFIYEISWTGKPSVREVDTFLGHQEQTLPPTLEVIYSHRVSGIIGKAGA